MKEYALLAFGVCLTASLLMLFSYKQMGERLAVGMISLFVLLSPVVKAVQGFDIDTAFDFEVPSVGDGGLSDYTEEAFAKGIRLAVADKFSLKEENISVRISGFDLENMRAEKIKVTLKGAAALADRPAIEKYINDMNIGECKVEIDLG